MVAKKAAKRGKQRTRKVATKKARKAATGARKKAARKASKTTKRLTRKATKKTVKKVKVKRAKAKTVKKVKVKRAKAKTAKVKRAKKTTKTVKRKAATKRVAKKTTAKRARKTAKRSPKAKRAARKTTRKPAARTARPTPTSKPKRPRRTKQALPPKPTLVPPIVDVEPIGPPREPPQHPLPEPDLDLRQTFVFGDVVDEVEPREVDAELVEQGPQLAALPGPNPGELAPDFSLPDETGQIHSLSQYRGQKVVLYFYPKDNTPGCTTEACGFRDQLREFTLRDAVVLGASPDSPDSHRRFIEKYGLTFALLSDEDHAVAERYGVWVSKTRFGAARMGIARTTFIIDTDGRILNVYRNVHAAGHADEVLKQL